MSKNKEKKIEISEKDLIALCDLFHQKGFHLANKANNAVNMSLKFQALGSTSGDNLRMSHLIETEIKPLFKNGKE